MSFRLRAPITALLAGAAALWGCPGPRPAIPSSAFLATGDTLIVPVQEVADAVWLEGTRWAILSPLDHAVLDVDLRRGRVTPFGGTRAQEIEQPFHILRDGETVWVADWQRRRATQWSAEGRLLGEMPAAEALRGALPRARDARGAWFFELRRPPGRDGSGNRDSAAIVRIAGATPDTIGRLAPLDLAEIVSDGRARLERRLLSGQDRWGVTAGGHVWIARVDKNRVDWIFNGQTVRGEQLPDPVLPVTQNDRNLFLNRFEPGLRSTVEAIPFAAIKPPFEFAQTGPGETAWLTKNRAVGDSLRFYQVVDSGGTLITLLSHPGLGRVVAIGGGQVLVAESFEKGVRLLLYRVPEPEPAAGL